jgi:hypothetical protein
MMPTTESPSSEVSGIMVEASIVRIAAAAKVPER